MCLFYINMEQPVTSKRKPTNIKLIKPEWDVSKLKPICKNVYEEQAAVAKRTALEIKAYRDSRYITVQGNNLINPIFTFEEASLPAGITKVLDSKKYTEPTPIQSQAIPVALSGRDMVGIAKTGSGKTVAYILPAIAHLMKQPRPKTVGSPVAVVLAPTRELAQQIAAVATLFGESVGVKSACVYGGEPIKRQVVAVRQQIQLLIGTPGRLLDLMQGTAVSLKHSSYLVLDEADLMLDMGFEAQIREVVAQIRPDRQVLMWSATWPIQIQKLAEEFLQDYVQVNIGCLDLSANHSITQVVEVCGEEEKLKKLVLFLEEYLNDEEAKALIFVETKKRVDQLVDVLSKRGWTVKDLHGDICQKDRNKTINKFKDGRCKILIATDVASRGLDVSDVKFVINFDFPQTLEIYIHRIGRTGRWGRSGVAYTLFSTCDEDYAQGLVSVLQEAQQEVPPVLLQMGNKKKSKIKSKYFKTD